MVCCNFTKDTKISSLPKSMYVDEHLISPGDMQDHVAEYFDEKNQEYCCGGRLMYGYMYVYFKTV
jgi:hypothetical protein